VVYITSNKNSMGLCWWVKDLGILSVSRVWVFGMISRFNHISRIGLTIPQNRKQFNNQSKTYKSLPLREIYNLSGQHEVYPDSLRTLPNFNELKSRWLTCAKQTNDSDLQLDLRLRFRRQFGVRVIMDITNIHRNWQRRLLTLFIIWFMQWSLLYTPKQKG